jgi:hypothetical protein
MLWKYMPEGKEKYSAYLCSREWAVLKEAVKRRSKGICERCTVNRMDHVHHLTYERKYAERLDDLQACCKQCHEFIHGKSDIDPADERPIRIPWCRKTVKSFYLAGKITGTNWRDEIVKGWSDSSSECYADAFFSEPDDFWDLAPNAVQACGIKLHYCGPWWKDLECGHGRPSNNSGPHAYGYSIGGLDEYAMRRYAANRKTVADNVARMVSAADMVFAWIDSADCYGTIFEIGYAKALKKVVVVGVDNKFQSQACEMWLAFEGCYCVSGDSASDAWDEFWDLVAFEDKPSLAVGYPITSGPLIEAIRDSMNHADESDLDALVDALRAVHEVTQHGCLCLADAVAFRSMEATDGTQAR